MEKLKKKQYRSTIAFILLLFGGIFLLAYDHFETPEVLAGSAQNTSHWAWSSNIGWISFNCTDPLTCPPPVSNVDYGVHVDSVTGNFSGRAWSEHIGWISFGRAETFTPPESPYNGAEAFTACLDFPGAGQSCDGVGDNLVSGWARALTACKDNRWDGTKCTATGAGNTSGGWDGWIKLRGTTSLGIPYGVELDPATNEFKGWAWGGEVVGWLSFNCETAPGCSVATEDYYVKLGINRPPTAINLSVDAPNDLDYCGQGFPPVRVRWNFIDRDPGDTQSAYQIQVDDDSDFSSPIINRIGTSSGVPSCPLGKFCTVLHDTSLVWDKTYYWRLKVWDNGSPRLESDWVYPPSDWVFPPFPSVLPITPMPGSSFETPPYPYPDPRNFSYSPVAPKLGDPTQFFDDNEGTLGDSFDGDPFKPDPAGKRISWQWDWDFDDGDTHTEINPATNSDPTHTYATHGTYIVTLTVTDQMGMTLGPSLTATCSAEKGVTVFSLSGSPLWKEVSPF